MEVLELEELRTLVVPEQTEVLSTESSKMANALRAAGPSDRVRRVVPSGSVIGSNSLASSIWRSSTTTNMTSWRRVAAAADDTTAVLKSCSLEHRSRACAAAR
jgi:hypothetical protein